MLELADGDTEFLGGLAADCGGAVVGVEQAGGRLLDEQPVAVVLDVAMQDPRYFQRTITVSFMAVDVRNHRLLNWQIGLP